MEDLNTNSTSADNFESDTTEELKPEGARALERLKQELKQTKSELYKYRTQYSDIDFSEYEQLRAEKAEREELELKKQKQYEKLEEGYRTKLNESTSKIDALSRDYEMLRLKFELQSHFYQNDGLEGVSALTGKSNFDILFEAIAPRLRRLEDGSLIVLDTKGEEDYNKDGTLKTVQDLFQEVSADPLFGKFFAAKTQASGTGAIPSNGRGRPRKQSWQDFVSQRGFKV